MLFSASQKFKKYRGLIFFASYIRIKNYEGGISLAILWEIKFYPSRMENLDIRSKATFSK